MIITFRVFLAAPQDYMLTSRELPFSSSTTRLTVAIPISPDDIVESVEDFFASLELLDTALDVSINPPETRILIEDSGDSEK